LLGLKGTTTKEKKGNERRKKRIVLALQGTSPDEKEHKKRGSEKKRPGETKKRALGKVFSTADEEKRGGKRGLAGVQGDLIFRKVYHFSFGRREGENSGARGKDVLSKI